MHRATPRNTKCALSNRSYLLETTEGTKKELSTSLKGFVLSKDLTAHGWFLMPSKLNQLRATSTEVHLSQSSFLGVFEGGENPAPKKTLKVVAGNMAVYFYKRQKH